MMGYASSFFKNFLPLVVLFIGIVLIFIFEFLRKPITKHFAILKERMRILYGYVTLIVAVISLISSVYLYQPFQIERLHINFIEITLFSLSLYLILSSVLLVLIFSSIVSTFFQAEKSFLAFLSLIQLQIALFFLLFSVNWIFIFFGYLLLFTSMNWYFRVCTDQSSTEKKPFSNYLVISSTSLGLIFIGISLYRLNFGTLLLTKIQFTNVYFEFFTLILILIPILIQIGIPPFHFWFFEQNQENSNGNAFLLVLFQRSVSLALLVKLAMIFRESLLSSFLFWLLLGLGIFCSLWGTLGSFTVPELNSLPHYLGLFHTGTFLIIFANVFNIGIFKLQDTNLVNILQGLSFNLLSYIILFSVIFPLLEYIANRFRITDFKDLSELRRSKPLIVILLLSIQILSICSQVISGYLADIFDLSINTRTPLVIFISYICLLLLSLVYVFRLFIVIIFKSPEHSLIQQYVEPGNRFSLVVSLLLLGFFIVLLITSFHYLSKMAFYILI